MFIKFPFLSSLKISLSFILTQILLVGLLILTFITRQVFNNFYLAPKKLKTNYANENEMFL